MKYYELEVEEHFNLPESGFPILWKYSGIGKINGEECIIYDQYQWIPGRDRHLISVAYAPYSQLPGIEPYTHPGEVMFR